MDKNEIFEKHFLVLEKLANGINPIDDSTLPTDSLINNVEVARALYFALSQLKTPTKTSVKKKNFYIEPDRLAEFEFLPEGAFLGNLIANLNKLIDIDQVKPLSRRIMVEWLVNIGILTNAQIEDSMMKRHMPTEQGFGLGLEIVKLQTRYGNFFDAVKYPLSVQKFILDNIDSLFNWIENK